MSNYDETAAALFEAAAPVAAYCQRATRPNQHAEQLDTLLLRLSEFGSKADELQAGYEGSQRIKDFCAGVRARMANTTQPPPHLHGIAVQINSYCLPLPAHARDLETQPL